MTKEEKFHNYFINVAFLAAENSWAEKKRVGAVLVKDWRIIATGWNGQPSGLPNICEKVIIGEDGKEKLETLPTVIHAEANLFMFCAKNGIPTNNTSIYITLAPCIKCSLLILQAGVKKVYYREDYKNNSGIEFLRSVGIEVIQI
jgi:dCMP deaminase